MNERRVVTKGSKDGTFQKGDHIIMYPNGDIGCIEEQGWIDFEDVCSATIGMESEVDVKWVERRKKAILGELAAL